MLGGRRRVGCRSSGPPPLPSPSAAGGGEGGESLGRRWIGGADVLTLPLSRSKMRLVDVVMTSWSVQVNDWFTCGPEQPSQWASALPSASSCFLSAVHFCYLTPQDSLALLAVSKQACYFLDEYWEK